MNQLEQLKKMTTIVADTGDIEAIRLFVPTDATTNPSLILAAAQNPEYRYLLEKAVKDTNHIVSSKKDRLEAILDHAFINFGLEILKIVPGRVSTEVDARLSFDTEASIAKARSFISLYEKAGVPRERILIKFASTWEGIRAAEVLEMEGIHCNMTLIFSLPQAIAAGEAKATLVSPFVGRILDWYKKSTGTASYPGASDPGVLSVQAIYTYLKKFDFKTQVMGASFRNKDEIVELAGCDLLTISPQFLGELQATESPLTQKLSPEQAKQTPIDRIMLNESSFRYLFNEDPMAVDKLSEGIRNFAKDAIKLQTYIAAQFADQI